MSQLVGPLPNANYLKSAIGQIYGDDEDFIVIGLTGRTGSGCSTVASLLQASRSDLRHSLTAEIDLQTNEGRKEKILLRHFEATWLPFLRIQVRAIIVTFLLDQESGVAADFFQEFTGGDKREAICSFLNSLRQLYLSVKQEPLDAKTIQFFTKTLPDECDALKALMGESAFVQAFQCIGKNIRLSGDPYLKTLVDGKFFSLAERIDDVIRTIRDARRALNQSTYIVVDAIRSPLEAIFFQDKYASFFLMAVSAPEPDRLIRLRKQKYSEADIDLLDKVEYTARDLDDQEFYSVQDIQACLQRADLYVSNPNVNHKVSEFQQLANQVIKFVSLIRRPGIVTPSAIERCMQLAYTAKLNSGCISRQVGATVTDENYSVRAIGWNDAPHGHVPCNLRSREDLLRGTDGNAYSNFEKTNDKYLTHFKERSIRFASVVKSGRSNSFCFKSEYNAFTEEKNQVHTRSLHAEENAFLQMSKYPSGGIEGGLLFTTASPCELCAKKAYQLGIKRIYYIDPYPGIAVEHILMGGTKNPQLILFSGAIGRAFHKLYSPIVPYKDELNAITR